LDKKVKNASFKINDIIDLVYFGDNFVKY